MLDNVSALHTVNANAGAGNTFNVTPIAGYKGIGVVGFQNSRGHATVISAAFVNVEAQTIYTYTRNITSTSYSDIQDHIRVLYIRDGFTV